MGFEYLKDLVVNFKLDFCCWFFPVKIGLLITGYLNVLSAAISILGISDDSFTPLISQLQTAIMGEDGKKPVPIIAYMSELVFSIVLLCGVYRSDVPLLRVYMKYCIAAIIMSVMFYSMVVAVTGVIVSIAMVFSVIFQIYVLILVRSILVQIRLQKKNQELPTLVMSTLVEEEKEKERAEKEKEKVEVVAEADVEAADETEDEIEVVEESKPEVKVETVDELPKIVTVQSYTPVFQTVRRIKE